MLPRTPKKQERLPFREPRPSCFHSPFPLQAVPFTSSYFRTAHSVSLMVAEREVRCGKAEHSSAAWVLDDHGLCVIGARFALISKVERDAGAFYPV